MKLRIYKVIAWLLQENLRKNGCGRRDRNRLSLCIRRAFIARFFDFNNEKQRSGALERFDYCWCVCACAVLYLFINRKRNASSSLA